MQHEFAGRFNFVLGRGLASVAAANARSGTGTAIADEVVMAAEASSHADASGARQVACQRALP